MIKNLKIVLKLHEIFKIVSFYYAFQLTSMVAHSIDTNMIVVFFLVFFFLKNRYFNKQPNKRNTQNYFLSLYYIKTPFLLFFKNKTPTTYEQTYPKGRAKREKDHSFNLYVRVAQGELENITHIPY
jgi:hypothetical protein